MSNVFKEAREIIRASPDKARRDILRDRVDTCKEAYDLFIAAPNNATMRTLLGHWTRLVQAIDAMPPVGGHDPSAGRVPVPKLPLAA